MRTTLVIEDRLFREAKRRAASMGTTLSNFVNDALRGALAQPPREPPPFKVIAFGEGLPAAHHEPKDLAEMLEEQDLESLKR
jgi:hypothetical protein